jgi:hypothetical protein
MSITMEVWIAAWSVRNQEPGCEVFATRDLAVNAAIGYALEMDLLRRFEVSEAAARHALLDSGALLFPDAGCYYEVTCQEVIASAK